MAGSDAKIRAKYELIHQISTDRRNAKAGLEVEVLDMTTGKQRNSKTLSGGEPFLVSLSLALGLSDVVQNHAGGRKLDALFIIYHSLTSVIFASHKVAFSYL